MWKEIGRNAGIGERRNTKIELLPFEEVNVMLQYMCK